MFFLGWLTLNLYANECKHKLATTTSNSRQSEVMIDCNCTEPQERFFSFANFHVVETRRCMYLLTRRINLVCNGSKFNRMMIADV